MRITEKYKRRIRNFIFSLTIICLAQIIEHAGVQTEAHTRHHYLYRDITCAIDLGDDMYSSCGLETGMNYELINMFARDNRCKVRIVTSGKDANFQDSLQQGKIDLLITHRSDSTCPDGISCLNGLDDCSVWMVKAADTRLAQASEQWMRQMTVSSRFNEIEDRFTGTYGSGKEPSYEKVSPYDDLFRKHASGLGWDWRLVAAVVYQESRFSINSRSSRGAVGLMQVMPKTGEYYGISDLEDPEQNISAGTQHLKRLKQMFSKWDLEPEELTKFTLAAYNAGEGRIIDCRRFAESKGYDSRKWEEVAKVIPLMNDDNILSDTTIVHGKFNGGETLNYIGSVMSHYQNICQNHPQK